MVLERYGSTPVYEDAQLLGQSITLPFSRRVAKSRFLKGGKSTTFLLASCILTR